VAWEALLRLVMAPPWGELLGRLVRSGQVLPSGK
jgi:hypothetical protein